MSVQESKKAAISVAVTGASGYIGGVLVKHLLAKGYQVHGTVRNLQDKAKVQHLQDLFPQMKLFEADLLKKGSFADCFAGCSYVFHTASPFQTQVKDAQKELIEPAVQGTENVIEEALKCKTVKKIVVTASLASVRRTDKPEDYIFSEEDWNETSTVESEPYPASKVLAEKKAWELFQKHDQKDHPCQLYVVNPSFVLGAPLSTRTDSTSVRVIAQMMSGDQEKDGTDPVRFAVVDVNDVASAHILAAESDLPPGRFLASSQNPVSREELARILKKAFPEYPLPTKTKNPEKMNRLFLVNNQKIQKELGLKFTPLEETLKNMGQALIDLGIVKKL